MRPSAGAQGTPRCHGLVCGQPSHSSHQKVTSPGGVRPGTFLVTKKLAPHAGFAMATGCRTHTDSYFSGKTSRASQAAAGPPHSAPGGLTRWDPGICISDPFPGFAVTAYRATRQSPTHRRAPSPVLRRHQQPGRAGHDHRPSSSLCLSSERSRDSSKLTQRVRSPSPASQKPNQAAHEKKSSFI